MLASVLALFVLFTPGFSRVIALCETLGNRVNGFCLILRLLSPG